MKSALFIMSFVMLLILPLSAWAGTEKVATEAANSDMAELSAKAQELVSGLPPEDLKILAQIQNSFGVLNSVNLVKKTVSEAVASCAKENPSLEAEVTGRYKEWDQAVAIPLKQTEAALNFAIDHQTFRPAKDIREFQKLLRKYAEQAEARLDKRPVTSEKACRDLLRTMDDTQVRVATLLKTLEIKPQPVVDPESGK